MGGSPSLVAMGGDNGCGFKCEHRSLDGLFYFYLLVVKIVMLVIKDKNMKKRPGIAL